MFPLSTALRARVNRHLHHRPGDDDPLVSLCHGSSRTFQLAIGSITLALTMRATPKYAWTVIFCDSRRGHVLFVLSLLLFSILDIWHPSKTLGENGSRRSANIEQAKKKAPCFFARICLCSATSICCVVQNFSLCPCNVSVRARQIYI